MKVFRRILKISGITLASIVGLLAVVMLALSVVLTPGRLTPVVNRYATEYLNASLKFDTVRLSLFSDFPMISVRLVGGEVVSHALKNEAAPVRADTLLTFREFKLSLNAFDLLRGRVRIRRIGLTSPDLYAYVAPSGKANWEIYASDTTATEDSGSPLDIDISRVSLKGGARIVYDSRPDGMRSSVDMERLSLKGRLTPDTSKLDVSEFRLAKVDIGVVMDSMQLDARVVIDTLGIKNASPGSPYKVLMKGNISAKMGGTNYCDSLPIGMNGGLKVAHGWQKFTLDNLALTVASVALGLDGDVTVGEGSIASDMQCSIPHLDVADVLELVPKGIFPEAGKISTDITLGLDTKIKGTYTFDGKTLPAVQLDCDIPGGSLAYKDVATRIDSVKVGMSVNFDPAEPAKTGVEIRDMKIAGTGISLHGKASAMNVLADAAVKGEIAGRLNIGDFVKFVPEDVGLQAKGVIGFTAKGSFRASDLTPQRIANADLEAKLTVDSLRARIPKDTVSLLALKTAVSLRCYAANSDRLVKKGARMLYLSITADTARIRSKRRITLGVSGLNVTARSSGDVAGGDTSRIVPMSGSVAANYLLMTDVDSTTIKVRAMKARFRLAPSHDDPALPAMSFSLESQQMSYAADGSNFGVRGANLTVEAVKKKPMPSRYQTGIDSLQKIYPTMSRDSAIVKLLGNRRSSRDEFSDKDIDMKADESITSMLRQWSIAGTLKATSGRVITPYLPLRTRVIDPDIAFTADSVRINNLGVTCGQSSFNLKGKIDGIRRTLSGYGRLRIDATIVADTLDANELLIAANQGSKFADASDEYKQSLAAAQTEDQMEKVIARQNADQSQETPLIVVPRNVEMDLGLKVAYGRYADRTLSSLTGELIVRDRTVQLKDIVAVTDAGEFDLTALYSTPNPKNLSVGLDLEMKSIHVEKLISMMPAVDTLAPMLSSFEGLLNCQVAATARIDTTMNIILPTLDAVCKIQGTNMVLLDGKTFTSIARLLKFKNRDRNVIDSISVQMLIRNSRIEIFPFVMQMDRYQTAISGFQNLDMSFKYHIAVIKSPLPFRLGITLSGPDTDHIKYGIGKAKYKDAKLPSYVRMVDTTRLNLRKQIDAVIQRGVSAARMNTVIAAVKVDTAAMNEKMEVLTRSDSLELARAGIIKMDTSFLALPVPPRPDQRQHRRRLF